MEKNKLYQHDPEEQGWDVDQSLFDHTPVKQGEKKDEIPYNNKQENLTAENYDDLYNNSQNVRNTKSREVSEKTGQLLTISTILIGSAVGIIAIINPLTTRPKPVNGVYSFIEQKLTYKFDVSNLTTSYECTFLILKDEVEIYSEKIEKSSVEGEYNVVDKGSYELKFYSTNNLDYKNSISLYTFNY